MTLEHGSHADIPWIALFPGISTEETERLKRTAESLETVSPGGPRTWSWNREAVVNRAPTELGHPILLDSDFTASGDYTECFDIMFAFCPHESGSVNISVCGAVDCFCETDHTMDQFDLFETDVDAGASLADAFDKAMAALREKLREPNVPARWRDEQGLPQPPERA